MPGDSPSAHVFLGFCTRGIHGTRHTSERSSRRARGCGSRTRRVIAGITREKYARRSESRVERSRASRTEASLVGYAHRRRSE